MPTIQVAKGVDGSPVRFSVQAVSPNGGFAPAAGQYEGDEPIVCQVWPGGDRSQVATLPVEWVGPNDAEPFDPSNPLVLASLPAAAYADLDAGVYKCRIAFADLSVHLVDFDLEVRDGPGSGVARPVYHTYKQLCDEFPAIDRLNDHLHDETGFADVSADSRDWIDAEILVSAAGQIDCWYARATDFAAALEADAIDLTTPMGKRLVKAAVNKSLAQIMWRAVGMTNAPTDLEAEAARRDALAESLLRSCRIAIDGWPVVWLGALRVGRLTR